MALQVVFYWLVRHGLFILPNLCHGSLYSYWGNTKNIFIKVLMLTALQSPFQQADGRREIETSSTKNCSHNLSLGTGERRVKIKWKRHCSWTAKVNSYKFSPSKLLTKYKCVQVLEEDGLRKWFTYICKVQVYSLWENHLVAHLKDFDNV